MSEKLKHFSLLDKIETLVNMIERLEMLHILLEDEDIEGQDQAARDIEVLASILDEYNTRYDNLYNAEDDDDTD